METSTLLPRIVTGKFESWISFGLSNVLWAVMSACVSTIPRPSTRLPLDKRRCAVMDDSKEGFVIVTWSVPSFVDAEPDKPGMVAMPVREGTFSSSQRIFIDAKRELMWLRYISKT